MAIRLGSSVTILAHGDRALREYPEEYVAKLVKKMEADGVRFMWNETVCGVEKLDDGYRVASKSGLEIDCDYILDATGRVANYENIGLEALGIEASAKGIVVNDHTIDSLSLVQALFSNSIQFQPRDILVCFLLRVHRCLHIVYFSIAKNSSFSNKNQAFGLHSYRFYIKSEL